VRDDDPPKQAAKVIARTATNATRRTPLIRNHLQACHYTQCSLVLLRRDGPNWVAVVVEDHPPAQVVCLGRVKCMLSSRGQVISIWLARTGDDDDAMGIIDVPHTTSPQ